MDSTVDDVLYRYLKSLASGFILPIINIINIKVHQHFQGEWVTMKNFLWANIIIAVCLLVIACSQVSQVAPSPVPSTTTATSIPLNTTAPAPSATAKTERTPRPTYVPPTLIPTIDPALLPKLLRNALSIQKLDLNGYKTQRVTGWDYGFGGRYSHIGDCPGFYWLDLNHLILYPWAGQDIDGFSGMFENIAPQPIVINLETGKSWLPSPDKPRSAFDCKQLNWSKELNLLITTETRGDKSTVAIYTYNGKKLASYPGKVLDVSPSGTKILIAEDTLIDLRTSKKIRLVWPLQPYEEDMLSELYWTYPDETQVYRCCYFYADLTTGTSYRFEVSDLELTNGKHVRSSVLPFRHGQWVRADKFFLVWWQPVDEGDVKYLPMFDPATKIFYDVRAMAGIPEDFTSVYTPVSPDGNYVWMEGWDESYLVNLITFKSQHYTYPNSSSYTDIDWSSDSEFSWFEIHDPVTKSTEADVLSISDMKLNPLPVNYQSETEHLWHPIDNILVYPAKDKNALIFLDALTMTYRELLFKDQTSQYKISNLAWNPNGDKLIFITENHILWQVDYPALDNLEQIIASANTINGAQWSPGGKAISFLNGSDIYIVDTNK
jgi:hypothetical protein